MTGKTENNIKILLIEDNPADANLLTRELAKLTTRFEVKMIDKKDHLLPTLTEFRPDIIISDYNIPGFIGLESLEIVSHYNPNIPFIYFSGTMGEERAVEAMIKGAKDCITKEHMKRLLPAIDRELEQAKKLKDHMKEHEELKLFRRIITNSYDAVAIYHNEQGLVFYNNEFKDLVNNLNQAIPTSILQTINYDKDILLKIEKEGVYRDEVIIPDKNGKKVFIDQSIFSFFDEVNNALYYIVMKRNVTDKKENEVNLISAKEKAEESDKLKSAFIANISHEIRTPINTIIGFTGLLTSQIDKEKQNEFISVIQSSSEQLLKVIEDILEISRIESNQIELKKDNFSLNNLMDEVYDYYAFYMGQQKPHIKLIHSKGENDLGSYIYSDPSRVKQVLTRLINNAFKFTEKGEISFGYRFDSNGVLFYVIDSGIGISDEASRIIFDRFRKADDNLSKKYTGTGLGLAISKQIVELLEGKIWVKSKPGEGSEFYFSLPLKKQENTMIDQDVTFDAKVLQGKTILVAEDDIMNFYLISEYMKGTGCNCYHAKDGREVLLLLREKKEIDLVFMDLKMPVMNGIEAFQKMRALNIKLPVIAQTAFTLDNDREKVLEMGFDDYISKPITKKILLSKLCQLLK